MLAPLSMFESPFIKPYLVIKKNLLSKYEKKLDRIVEENRLDQLYSLFTSYFSELFNLSINTINEDTIKREMKNRKLETEKIELLSKFLHECAQYSFASKEIANLHDLRKKAGYWLLLTYQKVKR